MVLPNHHARCFERTFGIVHCYDLAFVSSERPNRDLHEPILTGAPRKANEVK